MEQNIQTLTKTQFNEAAGANPGDAAAAEAYEAGKGKVVATDAEAAGDAALSDVSFPDKAALQAAAGNFVGDPDTVASQVAAEVDQHWSGYQQGQFAEAHGTDPVTAAHAAVEAAQAQAQPPQIPGAPQGGAV